MLQVRFWGTRGSIAVTGSSAVEFGGNTSCIELRAGGRLIIIDLGSGARELGNHLIAENFKKSPIDGDIFITHTHLDHLIGFPMFAPLFFKSNTFRIHGPRLPENGSVRSAIEIMTSYQFWPVRLSEFAAKLTFNIIVETTLDLGGGLKVTSKLLNHPVITLGYRFEYHGKTVVTAFDTEPYRNLFTDEQSPFYSAAADSEGRKTVKEESNRMLEFISGADILIYDSPYTEAEYQKGKQGWGHTPLEYAIRCSKEAGVKKLIVFHHEPSKTDKVLREIEECNFPKNIGMEIIAAKEGMSLTA
ncbi:MAG: MBL fold metallo-hydrolase [Spirochaetaceae bacterium]|jgi:phosphoribosyl 1,2-cyclic phosphodiesterase|nr:MBL fold metallo-hydrolase [Spirochaetaceae bacterium]